MTPAAQAIQDHISAAHDLIGLIPAIDEVDRALRNCIQGGGKILICGNGGSAADAQHFAAELVVRYLGNRKAIPAIALTTDSSVLTAAGNDYSFARIFSRQVSALGRKGDALIAISTSGQSENVSQAIGVANLLGMTTIGLTGPNGMGARCDYELCMPTLITARIQELHILCIHILCEALENVYE